MNNQKQNRLKLQAIPKSYILLISISIFLSTGCHSIPWKLYRTVSPYSKTQLPNPYANTIRVAGGAEFGIRKFYVTKTLACMVLRASSKNAYAEIYVNPHKATLVAEKLGIPAMKSTMASREPLYRRMVQDYYKIKDPETVSRWSKYYFPRGVIPGGKAKEGMLCFQLARDQKDKEKLVIKNKCRMKLTGVLVAKGPATLDWLYFAPLKKNAK